MFEYLILVIAAFLAGVLNTIAGGGTFLTLPALVYAGIPPVSANATSAVVVLPGYLGGTVGFRGELGAIDRSELIRVTAMTAVGGLIGSLLLLVSSNETFSAVVPFLLLAATVSFTFEDRIQDWARATRFGLHPYGALGTVLVSIYGGYFNGGLGIVLLALFSMWGMRDLDFMNGLKSGMSFVLTAISVLTFAIAGIVEWLPASVMMVAATAGGYAGASIARALNRTVIRVAVILIGLTMSAIFFWVLLR